MKQCLNLFTSVALLAFLFSGCEKADDHLNETDSIVSESAFEESNPETKLQEENLPSYFVTLLKNYENKLVNTYNVEFTGRVVKGTGDNVTTTFNYTVSGTNQTPLLDSFYLEIPGCAGTLSGWAPQQASSLSEGVIKWNNSVKKDGSQNYSITFNGNVPLGIINTTVTRGSNEESAKILGPCKGVYTLSGSIFIDADGNGEKDAAESGLPSIPVDLFNSAGEKITSVSTTGTGFYSFMVVEGNYKVAVGEEFLNNTGYTPIENGFVVLENVTENISALNFGYTVNSSKITKALEDKVIPVDTEPTKFWVQQIRQAGKKNSVYSQEQIREFLVAIEGIFLSDPFQFGTDKEKNAIDILTRPIRTDYDEFLQQLLTAELNIVSGRGALKSNGEPNKVFNDALMIYGEAVACRENPLCSGQTTRTATAETKAISTGDTSMLRAFNGSGGIN